LVSKIELEKTEGDARATGVQFMFDGHKHSVKAKREVIICGGSINSPQILELSGIGRPDVLRKAGVEVIVENMGVGENLTDHTASAFVFVSRRPKYPSHRALLTAIHRVSKTSTQPPKS
jgi:choline dehydrogenase